jgi:predicted dehydrogenase
VSGRAPLGVGFLGAGPVVQTIHLPTLALMPDLFTPASVMDVNTELAAAVAAPAGAAHTGSLEEILADPAIDVIAVCSPQQFHAQQVIAAMRAGKKAILCEKPLVTSIEDARIIGEVSVATGVPLLVGTMHVFDPAWVAVREAWGAFPASVRSVRSNIVLPLNDRFEDWASQAVGRPAADFAMPDKMTPDIISRMFDALILGLAVHALPLVRTLLPDHARLEMLSSRQLAPFGYMIGARAGDRALQLVGTMHGHGEAFWELEAVADEEVLSIRFTPSFVHAGSAIATLHLADGSSRQFGPYVDNGYTGEWRALHAAAHGDKSAIPSVATLIEDLGFVLDVAKKASACAIEGMA